MRPNKSPRPDGVAETRSHIRGICAARLAFSERDGPSCPCTAVNNRVSSRFRLPSGQSQSRNIGIFVLSSSSYCCPDLLLRPHPSSTEVSACQHGGPEFVRLRNFNRHMCVACWYLSSWHFVVSVDVTEDLADAIETARPWASNGPSRRLGGVTLRRCTPGGSGKG